MTEPTSPDPLTTPAADVPQAEAMKPAAPQERVRVEAPAPRRADGLPLLYLLGFLVVVGTGYYLYRNPVGDHRPELVDTVTPRIDALQTRLTQLESRPEATPPNLAPLEGRIAALEGRLAALEARPAPVPDLGPITSRLDAATAKQTDAVAALTSRIDATDGKQNEAMAALAGRVDAATAKLDATSGAITSRLEAFEGRVASAEKSAKDAGAQASQQVSAAAAQLGAQVDAKVGSVTETARQLSRLQAAGAALAAGQKLGEIPGAPPALARFATEAPPTEYQLRLAFPAAAQAAAAASQPEGIEDKPFLDRVWGRAQRSVSVRQGDRMVLGDAAGGILARAKQALDGGDLPAALTALDGLSVPSKAAMAGWIGQARALVEARAALAQLAARG